MKKQLFKTVTGIFILIVLLTVLTPHHSFAGSMDNTLCDVIVNRGGSPRLVRDMVGEWTSPVLVFSNKKLNVYTGDDTITGNLFSGNMYGDFLGTGNFLAQLYLEIKDKKGRKEFVEEIKSNIAKQPSLAMIGNPDLFTFVVYYAFFDMKNNIVSLQKWEKFLDRDGDLIMANNIQADIALDNESDFKLIANGIIAVLNKAKNDPKIADKIRGMQRHGNNMTDISRLNALRNAKIAHGENPNDIEYLSLAIRLKPDYMAYANRGYAYNELGQYQQAIKDYDESIRLKPDKAEAYNNRGYAYDGLGQYQQAIKDYDKAIRLKPDFTEAYSNRGDKYKDLGQHQLAINDYNKVISLKPDYRAYANRGGSYNALGQYQQAIKDYDESIRLKPDEEVVYTHRGNAYYKLGQYQQAIKDYDEAIRLKPDEDITYNNRGLTYIKLGQYQQAIKNYDEVIRLKPDNADAYNNRGFSYQNLSQYQQAIKDYDEAIHLKPDNADAYSKRGLVYILSGNNQEGCRSLVRACELKYCKDYDLSKQKGNCR